MLSLEQLVRPNIHQLAPYSSARHEFVGTADIYIDANENPNDTGLNRYPDPLQKELKAALSLYKNVPAQNIFLGNGSDEAIDLLIRIFCEPRIDHIIVLPPTYGMYKVGAAIADVEVKSILLTEDFQPNVDAILEATNERSKLLFLCTPNNPTGTRFERKYVKQLLSAFSGIVVIDEAYIDFSDQKSYSQLLDEYPNLVVLQTFSKAWGLAAIRLGIAYASAEIIHFFNKVKPPYNVNILTQQAALKSLQQSEQQEAWTKQIVHYRSWLACELLNMSFVKRIYPSDANFLLVCVEDADDLYHYLVKQGIIVRNRSNQPRCTDCLRFTVGTESENERLLEALSNYEQTSDD